MEQSPAPRSWHQVYWATAAALALGIGGYVWVVHRAVTISGLRAGGVAVGGVPFAALDGTLDQVGRDFLAGEVRLRVPGGVEVKRKRGDLGLFVDKAVLRSRLVDAGRSGDPLVDLPARWAAGRGRFDVGVPVGLTTARAVEVFCDLKDELDRAAIDAHLDLDQHRVAPGKAGLLVEVYDSVARLEAAVAAGRFDVVELATTAVPPKVEAKELDNVDISTVLASWETRYSSTGADSDRTYNLKVGADHLNGHILQPGQIFSFNAVVGDRTEKEGYRVAPVISAGELVDGLAGGMCQIASTLHAAAMFAGLDIVASTPHSRPSAYVPMGLDSTVVYPSVDLKLRNPYAFPVVMHYKVNQGAVKVELLGKERPVQTIFEREIKGENGFGTQTRRDPAAPAGQRLVLQEGYPGYSLARRRYLFERTPALPRAVAEPGKSVAEALEALRGQKRVQLPKLLKKNEWAVSYPSTALIVAIGSGPAKLRKKEPPPSHHIPPVRKEDKPIWKLVR